MKVIKKTLLLLLALLMLIPAVVSCKKDEPDEGGTGAESGVSTNAGNDAGSEAGTSKYDVYDDVGEMDLGGRVISIAQSQEEDYRTEVAVQRITGEVVNDAVFERNAHVQERLNCKIENVVVKGDGNAVLDQIDNAVKGGDQLGYQFILNMSYMTCARIVNGIFYDLKDVGNLDLSKSYWSQLLNETYTIGGAQYTATGAISTSYYRFIFVNLLNDRMLAETNGEVPDVIGMVKDGKWTMENQKVLINNYYEDLGAYGKDGDDKVGFVGNTGIMFDAYLSSGDVQVLKKGNDGYYYYDFDNYRATEVMNDLVDLITAEGTFCYGEPATMEPNMLKKFASGTALIGSARLVNLEGQTIKQMKDKYTILPVAKWSEDQDYYSLVSDRFTAVAIPVTVSKDDVDTIGAVIEVLASESYHYVTPTYFETVLRMRYSSSPDRWEILQKITDNVKMDACLPYTSALTLTGHVRDTIIKLWRYTGFQGYVGTPKAIDTIFTQSVADGVEEKLNGERGLQTYIKAQLANKTT